MSDTPRTEKAKQEFEHQRIYGENEIDEAALSGFDFALQLERELNQAIKERDEWMLKAAKAIRKHDDALKDVEWGKAGWDRASLTALDLEQRLKRAEKCISAIEAHYKSKHGESYYHTTLNTIITNWKDIAKTPQS